MGAWGGRWGGQVWVLSGQRSLAGPTTPSLHLPVASYQATPHSVSLVSSPAGREEGGESSSCVPTPPEINWSGSGPVQLRLTRQAAARSGRHAPPSQLGGARLPHCPHSCLACAPPTCHPPVHWVMPRAPHNRRECRSETCFQVSNAAILESAGHFRFVENQGNARTFVRRL